MVRGKPEVRLTGNKHQVETAKLLIQKWVTENTTTASGLCWNIPTITCSLLGLKLTTPSSFGIFPCLFYMSGYLLNFMNVLNHDCDVIQKVSFDLRGTLFFTNRRRLLRRVSGFPPIHSLSWFLLFLNAIKKGNNKTIAKFCFERNLYPLDIRTVSGIFW